MAENNEMKPMSGEKVEIDGTYENEWGAQTELDRGDVFPADQMLGTTEWELVEYRFDNHHEGQTDQRLIRQKDEIEAKSGKITHPRRHIVRKDR